MTKQLAFYFNASACNGCKACAIACKSKNDLPVGINWRRVYEYGGGDWVPDPLDRSFLKPKVFAYAMSVACMHCQNPVCLQVCPAAAISKDDNGIVTIDANLCIGCRYCQWACPYGAPQFNEAEGIMTKCNMCQDIVAQGEKPYCVEACVMRAMDFGTLEELRQKYGNIDAIEPLPPSNITNPSVVVTPHKDSQESGKGTGRILDLVEV
jgi:anaerobic dimethyl sulfoxide reductase subunit B (iron-sulfur subunit)